MKSLQSSETFQFLWWNCLIPQNETKYAVFSKKKERKTNKQTAVVIKYVICGKVRLAFCTIWLLSWSKGWFTKSAWRTKFVYSWKLVKLRHKLSMIHRWSDVLTKRLILIGNLLKFTQSWFIKTKIVDFRFYKQHETVF